MSGGDAVVCASVFLSHVVEHGEMTRKTTIQRAERCTTHIQHLPHGKERAGAVFERVWGWWGWCGITCVWCNAHCSGAHAPNPPGSPKKTNMDKPLKRCNKPEEARTTGHTAAGLRVKEGETEKMKNEFFLFFCFLGFFVFLAKGKTDVLKRFLHTHTHSPGLPQYLPHSP